MHRFLASWFGLGFLPRRIWGHDGGAGTVGALGALVIGALLLEGSPTLQLGVLALVVVASLWSVRPFAVGHADPRWVCIDEAAGTLLALLGLHGWLPVLVSFAVFRLADIPKRFPLVNRAQTLPGSVGILADDLVAGAYGLAAGWLVQLTLPGP